MRTRNNRIRNIISHVAVLIKQGKKKKKRKKEREKRTWRSSCCCAVKVLRK